MNTGFCCRLSFAPARLRPEGGPYQRRFAQHNMNTATIAAIATPPGSGGIGIIRISGSKALDISQALFRPGANGGKPTGFVCGDRLPVKMASHRLYYGHIVDPETKSDVDEVLLAVMQGPRSYTREDVVEIQAHGGGTALRLILELVLRHGARMAEPGEFTQRAFMNGRIDLTQAEAVIDIINAKTESALKMATSQAAGKLKMVVENMRTILFDLLAHIEAAIDFPEDVLEILSSTGMVDTLRQEVVAPILDLMRQYEEGRVYRDGVKMAIIGRPNVGKSSLLNRLLEKERAIVDALPGTTRDLIEDSFQVKGIWVTVADTAGLHEAEDPVEIIGMRKTSECLELADLILLVLDGSVEPSAEDHKIYQSCRGKPVILAINKIDIAHSRKIDVAVLPDDWDAAPAVAVSALHGDGIDRLKACIADAVILNPRDVRDHSVVPSLRHQQALEKCHQYVMCAINGLQEDRTIELVALDIREAIGRCDEILGINVDCEILERIFSRFCIGK